MQVTTERDRSVGRVSVSRDWVRGHSRQAQPEPEHGDWKIQGVHRGPGVVMCGHSSACEEAGEAAQLERSPGVRAEGSREAWC